MSWVAAAISVVELLSKTPQDGAARLEPLLKAVLSNQTQLLHVLRELEDETTLKVQQAIIDDMAASCGAYAAQLQTCAAVVQEQQGQLGAQADALRRLISDASHLAFKSAQPQYLMPAHQLLAGIITTCRLAYGLLMDVPADQAFVAQLRGLVAPLYVESRRKVLAAQQESELAKREAARHAAYCEADPHVTKKGGGGSTHAPSNGFEECIWETTYTLTGTLEQGFTVHSKDSPQVCTWHEKRSLDEAWSWLDPATEERIAGDREQRGAAAGAQAALKAANAAAARYRSAQRQLQGAQLLVQSVDAVGKALS